MGSLQVVTVMRASGEHGDMTGAGSSQVFKQIGVGLHTAALYRAIVAASVNLDTRPAFAFLVTPQLVYNAITGNIGVAAIR